MGADSEKHGEHPHQDMDLRKELNRSESERRRLESVIGDLENRLNTVIRNVSEIIYMLDSNGLITFINDGVERIGFSPKELIGINIFELVHPQDRARAFYRINERRRGERSTREYEVRFVTKDNASGHIDTAKRSPLLKVTAEGQYRFSDGDALSFVGTVGVASPDECAVRPSGIITPGSDHELGTTSMVPICASCKDIRNRKGEWERIESFLGRACGMTFTHTICPVCTRKLYPEIEHPDE